MDRYINAFFDHILHEHHEYFEAIFQMKLKSIIYHMLAMHLLEKKLILVQDQLHVILMEKIRIEQLLVLIA